MLTLVVLVAVIYGYWHLTNDRRIRRQAKWYLRRLTGAHVTVAQAHFSLFGNIELKGVNVFLPPDAGGFYPLLQAESVILSHRPWSLLLHRRVQPIEITFLEPSIVIEHYTSDGTYNFQKLLSRAKIGRSGTTAWQLTELPRIRVRGCRARPVEVMGKLLVPGKQTRWDMSMIPESKADYLIKIEQPLSKEQLRTTQEAYDRALASLKKAMLQEHDILKILRSPADARPDAIARLARNDKALIRQLEELVKADEAKRPLWAAFSLNVPTGSWRARGGSASFLYLAQALPSKWRKWLDIFNLEGRVDVLPESRKTGAKGPLKFRLSHVSLKLPVKQGGLVLEDVRGVLAFDEKGLTFQDVTGRLVQGGYARFELSGRYDGYEENSPLQMKLKLHGVSIPRKLPGESGLGKFVDMLHRWYKPEGRLDLWAQLTREKGQKLQVEALAEPKDMSICYQYFPYRVRDLRGSIALTSTGAELLDLTCRRGSGRARIAGTVGLGSDRGKYNVTVNAQDIRCDKYLLAAIPKSYQRAWRMVNPTGTLSPIIHVSRKGPDTKRKVAMDIIADGHASVTCSHFPYRVDNVFGRVQIAGGVATIERFRARRGSMRCAVEGTISGINTSRPDVDITVATTSPMPIDDVLLAALDKRSRARLADLRATGLVQVAARVRQSKEQKLRYEIRADVGNVTLKPKVFPYRMTGGSGELLITPGHVQIKSFRAYRGRAQIDLITPGNVYLEGDKPTVVLDITTGVFELEKDLYKALPKAVQDTWRRFSPSGKARADISLRYNTPENKGKLVYDLVLEAKDVEVTYQEFPHTLRGLRGVMVASPGKVVLKDLVSKDKNQSAVIGGQVIYDEKTTNARLSIRATGVPIDTKILAAMPKGIVPLTRILRPGGTCDVDLPSLTFERRLASASSRASSAPPGEVVSWQAKGKISFSNAVAALGKGKKRFSGSLTGSAGRDGKGKGVALDTDMAIESIFIGKRRITGLEAKMRKAAAGNVMHIKEMSAKSHGGALAGFAEIKLTDPLQYGVSISVERMRLEDIFKAGDAAPKLPLQVGGLLDGRIQLTGSFGKIETRRASGVMRISKATVYEVPVMLGLLHVVYLGLPGDSAFTDGNLRYRLKGQQLILEEIHLIGSALSIVGSGTVDMKTGRLKLTFLTGPPGSLPRIPELESLLKGIAREIMQIHVTGTLDKPKMTTVPLPSLKDAIENLLRPEQEKR